MNERTIVAIMAAILKAGSSSRTLGESVRMSLALLDEVDLERRLRVERREAQRT